MKKIFHLFLVALLLLSSTPAFSQGSLKNRLKVGLVFGGGGAKGAAEVGVLKAIEEVGIPIDYIAGTSIGSIVGGLYSIGYRSDDIEKMFLTQEWITLLSDRNMMYQKKPIVKKNGVTYILGFPVGNKNRKETAIDGPGALRGDSVQVLLERMTKMPDSINFMKLPIPFNCVAVNVKNMSEVVFSKGVLSQAMRASMAIPGVFKPVKIDSLTLIDGGALNNLPVDVVKKMGADVVIAIDLTQKKRKARDKQMKNVKGIGLIIEWVKKRPDLIKYNENLKECDVYINPDLKGYDAADFKTEKIQEMIEQGVIAGKDAMPSLQELKKKIYR